MDDNRLAASAKSTVEGQEGAGCEGLEELLCILLGGEDPARVQKRIVEDGDAGSAPKTSKAAALGLLGRGGPAPVGPRQTRVACVCGS